MAYIEGAQTTGNILSSELQLEIHPNLIYLDYNLRPLLHLAMGKGENGLPAKKSAIGSYKYSIQQKASKARFTAINCGTAGYTPSQTTFTVDDATPIMPYDLVELVGDGEIVRVESKSNTNNTITVTRAFGVTASPTSIANNTPVMILGNARDQHSAKNTAHGVKVNQVDNYTQIIDHVIELSRTLENCDMVYGKKKSDLAKEALRMWKEKAELAFLFGQPLLTADATSGRPLTQTGGIWYFTNAEGNITTCATGTFAVFLAWITDLFEHQNSESKVVLASPLWVEAINYWQQDKLRFRPTDKLGGMWAGQMETGNGTIYIVRDTLLQNSSAGTTTLGYGGALIGFEPEDIGYVHLKNSDLKTYVNAQTAGTDGTADILRGEIGFWLSAAQRCYLYSGLSSYS